MKSKNLNKYMIAVVFMLVGVMLALDWLNIDLFGLHGSWVATLLSLLCVALIVSQCIQRKIAHVFTPTICGIIGAMLFLISASELKIDTLWPMIPLAVSLAILLSSLLRDHVKLFTEIGFVGVVLSIACLIGSVFSLWHIVFPIVLVLGGIVIILRSALTKEEEKYEIPSLSFYERAEKINEKEEQK